MKCVRVNWILKRAVVAVKNLFPHHNTFTKPGPEYNAPIPVLEKKAVEMTKKNYPINTTTVECYCKRCHRKLTNPKYIEIGMGSVCLKKAEREKQLKPLFKV